MADTNLPSSHYGVAVFGVILLSKAVVAFISSYSPSFLRPPAVNVILELTVLISNIKRCAFVGELSLLLYSPLQSEIKELREQHRKVDHPDTFVSNSGGWRVKLDLRD